MTTTQEPTRYMAGSPPREDVTNGISAQIPAAIEAEFYVCVAHAAYRPARNRAYTSDPTPRPFMQPRFLTGWVTECNVADL